MDNDIPVRTSPLTLEAVVSLLDEAHDEKVRAIWAVLEREFGLQAIYSAPYPHFSYHGAKDFDDAQVEVLLERVAREYPPFKVYTAGLGLFLRPKPVLYLPVVRSAAVSRVHRALWPALNTIATEPNEHYQPDYWLPHISLTHGDLRSEMLPGVVRLLGEFDLRWEIEVNTLALVYTAGVDQGLKLDVSFSGAG